MSTKIAGVFLSACIATLVFASLSLATDRPYDGTGPLEVIKEISIFRKERDSFFKKHSRSPLRRMH
jgi:hypothetical protein